MDRGNYSDAWKFVAHHCANGSSKIKGVDFDQSYSTKAHVDYFRINIAIVAIHRLAEQILDVSDALQNTKVSTNEKVCVIPPPYYLYWFKKSYPNVTLNRGDGEWNPGNKTSLRTM